MPAVGTRDCTATASILRIHCNVQKNWERSDGKHRVSLIERACRLHRDFFKETDEKKREQLKSCGHQIIGRKSPKIVGVIQQQLAQGEKFCATGGVGKKIRDVISNIKDYDLLRRPSKKVEFCASKTEKTKKR